MGESLECDGEYDLSSNSASECPFYEQTVITTGLIVDFYDITPFNGPHSFTIESKDHYRIDFVVWPESSEYQDGFDITQSELSHLAEAPFGLYEVEITGELGAYCYDDELLDINSEWQVTVEYENDIIILQEYSNEGDYFSDNYKSVEINPEPYVLIPNLGERLNFSYTFPENSQIRIRVFDLSGRFITSLVSEYREYSGIVEMNGSAAWDGQDELGQIVSPGTYLIHIEAHNFSTGKTYVDIAPIVVGVNQ